MAFRLKLALALSIVLLGAEMLLAQPAWPRFRGPNGAGISESDHALPVTFDEKTNALWQTSVSEGHSSPVIWGDRIFLTGKNNDELETLCLNRQTGEILWRKAAPKVKAERVHRVNSLASPTPATDGERVVVYFGSYGLLCYDYDGTEVWRRPLEKKLRNTFGAGSSPILMKDYLIFSCENQTESFIEAI
ncbi:PQQ-binding-like beta-propeller repeat protein, partial [bacterium]|nr:PQQ-binding-like beta-propeller repeat protein [bacterium]